MRSHSYLRFILTLASTLLACAHTAAQPDLRHKLGQMVMVTVTGDSVEESGASMDTLKSDLEAERIGGLIMYTWSGNLNNPEQIAHFTSSLQHRASIPLLLAIDEEGGKVARLGSSNGFSTTPSAYQMGTVVNEESYTRSVAATMAEWFTQTGLNLNLAPVADVNVNPLSPAIGALGRSFSADPESVACHAGWFIDEFHTQHLLTTLKHFPGHGSATSDSHLGFTDVTTTWSPIELIPYTRLLERGIVDVVMTAHVYDGTIDSVYPATLSYPTITGILRNELGYQGVVVSDEMSMSAISGLFGLDEAMELAVKAGVDILLYNSNLDSTGHSLAGHVIDVLERSVQYGRISQARIDSSYERILALKSRLVTSVARAPAASVPHEYGLTSYPNPFNPSTLIRYSIPGGKEYGERSMEVRLVVYDILGREVALLVAERQTPGTHEVRFDASGFASGIYICRLTAGKDVESTKMMLVK